MEPWGSRNLKCVCWTDIDVSLCFRGIFRLSADRERVLSDVRFVPVLGLQRPGNRELLYQPVNLHQ